MKITILGAGGVLPIPRPCCPCPLCQSARQEPECTWQTGPSMFIHNEAVLFDTPEEIRFQLLRSNIDTVRHILYTHWHPDHTQGMRVIEQITKRRPETMPIYVHIAKEQLDLLCRFGCGNMLKYFEKQKLIQIHLFEANSPIIIGQLCITPVSIEKTQGFFFLIEDRKKKMVYAPCEYHGLVVPSFIRDIDTLFVHCLWFEDKRIGNGINFSDTEDSFETMLEHAHQMNAKKIIVMHIEESFASTINQLNQSAQLCYPDHNIEFANDGMIIDM